MRKKRLWKNVWLGAHVFDLEDTKRRFFSRLWSVSCHKRFDCTFASLAVLYFSFFHHPWTHTKIARAREREREQIQHWPSWSNMERINCWIYCDFLTCALCESWYGGGQMNDRLGLFRIIWARKRVHRRRGRRRRIVSSFSARFAFHKRRLVEVQIFSLMMTWPLNLDPRNRIQKSNNSGRSN